MNKEAEKIKDPSIEAKTRQILAMKNKKDKHGRTSLIKACEEGLNDLAMHLIREGADINIKDNQGRSPLSIALEKGNNDLALSLISNGANISVVANSVLLHAEFFKHNPHLIKFLSPNGVEGSCALSPDAAIFVSDKATVEAIKTFVESGGNINTVNIYNQTFLMMASDTDQIETAKYLIEKGADVNLQDTKGNTALMYSAKKGNLEISELLLTNKAAVNTQNIEGKTALMMSVEENHLAVTKKLVEHNADITIKDKEGENVLIKAAKKGHLDTIKFFVEECCENKDVQSKSATPNPDAKNTNQPIAVKSIKNPSFEKTSSKIKLKEFINTQDNKGKTALMHAYENKHIDVFKYLLEQKADILIKDKNGENIYSKIFNDGDMHFSNLLKESSPENNYKDLRMQTIRKSLGGEDHKEYNIPDNKTAPISIENYLKEEITLKRA